MRELLEKLEGKGSGTGSLKKGKKLTGKDFPKLKKGDVLIAEGSRFGGTVNVVRVTKIKESPSRGFNGIFADPANPKKNRMPSDNEFFVWADDLDDPKHSSTYFWTR